MILRMNIELETEGMTLMEFAAFIDKIKYLTGAKGRIKCSLARKAGAFPVELLTQPALR